MIIIICLSLLFPCIHSSLLSYLYPTLNSYLHYFLHSSLHSSLPTLSFPTLSEPPSFSAPFPLPHFNDLLSLPLHLLIPPTPHQDGLNGEISVSTNQNAILSPVAMTANISDVVLRASIAYAWFSNNLLVRTCTVKHQRGYTAYVLTLADGHTATLQGCDSVCISCHVLDGRTDGITTVVSAQCYCYLLHWWSPFIPSRNLDEVFTYNHIYGSNVPSKPLSRVKASMVLTRADNLFKHNYEITSK